MKILLTGGAGFVGRAMIRHIRQFFENVYLTVIDDLSEDPDTFFEQGLDKKVDRFLTLDIADSLFRTWAQNWKFDLVIHCAARIKGKEFQVNSPLAIAQNLAIDQSIIQAVQNGLAEELIYFSSCAAYGQADQWVESVPNFEEQLETTCKYKPIYSPEGIYGWCKLIGEYECSLLKDKKVTVLRPFGGYGTDQSLQYPFPALIQRVTRGDDPVVVWGSGNQIRDWIHVKDICRLSFEAHWRGARTVNLGTGRGINFIDLACSIADLGNRPYVVIKNDPSKPEGVAYRVADTCHMNRFELYPKITIEHGIEWALRGEV